MKARKVLALEFLLMFDQFIDLIEKYEKLGALSDQINWDRIADVYDDFKASLEYELDDEDDEDDEDIIKEDEYDFDYYDSENQLWVMMKI